MPSTSYIQLDDYYINPAKITVVHVQDRQGDLVKCFEILLDNGRAMTFKSHDVNKTNEQWKSLTIHLSLPTESPSRPKASAIKPK